MSVEEQKDVMEVVDEEVDKEQALDDDVDVYQHQFHQLDTSTKDAQQKIADFLVLLQNSRADDQAIKVKEQCIYRLARIYTEGRQFAEVMALLKSNNDFFGLLPKARTAKIVRNILNIISSIPDSLIIQVEFCKDVVEWCKLEKRTFLRQRIEAKLAGLLLQQKQPIKALEMIDELLKELRKLDDKQMLTETHLTEARIYHSLQNIPKSKSSLTASRSSANSIYVSPTLQAEIDEMSGMLHCEESDYTTAYSYFLEAFDAYDQASSQKAAAVNCLKYMILCKVLNSAANEIPALLASKIGVKHSGIELEAMAAIAKAAKVHSLEDFEKAAKQYEAYLKSDDLISHHLDLLYDKMLESNLLKIIHPYSSVEISYIAKIIKLSEQQVVHKLSQMILDHKFFGILDQGKGFLIIYDSSSEDVNFTKAGEIINNMGQVVDVLYQRAKSSHKSATN